MEYVRCAQCRNPIRGRQAFVTHARSDLTFHADCWADLHERVQQQYAAMVALEGVDSLLGPYSRDQTATWLPTVAQETPAAS